MSPVIDVYRQQGSKVTPAFLQSLEAERILFDSQGRWLTLRASGLKTRRLNATILVRLSRGRLMITKNRLVAIVGGRKMINIPKDDPLYKNLTFDKSNPRRYTISLDLSQFPGDMLSQMSLSYHIDSSNPALP